MSDRDYYEILGITPRADGAMVDASYWHLVRKYQALAATNPRAQRLIDELNEAYGVLGNPRLRKQYDAFRDDVLIQSGMIQPVASKPKRAKKSQAAEEADPKPAKRGKRKKGALPEQAARAATRAITVPQVRIENWRTYGLAGIIAVLAFAAAWQGVNIVLVVLTLAGGLTLALMPTLTRRIGDMNFDMPAIPNVSVPQVKTPKINLAEIPAIRELSTRDEPGIDADTLRQSTAATISRWRQSVGLRVVADAAPVDEDVEELALAAQEVEVDESSTEPLDAVMTILRHGASRTTSR